RTLTWSSFGCHRARTREGVTRCLNPGSQFSKINGRIGQLSNICITSPEYIDYVPTTHLAPRPETQSHDRHCVSDFVGRLSRSSGPSADRRRQDPHVEEWDEDTGPGRPYHSQRGALHFL